MKGPWHKPHDPEPLPNGHIMLFDNQALHGRMGGSRVIEFDPGDSQIVWQYRGEGLDSFDSPQLSRQQMLPNGNVLIAEAEGGRILEVTRDRQVAWSFMHPVRHASSNGRNLVPIVSDVVRYAPASLPFLRKNPDGQRFDGSR
jgi:hypothetical protein